MVSLSEEESFPFLDSDKGKSLREDRSKETWKLCFWEPVGGQGFVSSGKLDFFWREVVYVMRVWWTIYLADYPGRLDGLFEGAELFMMRVSIDI